MSFRTGRFAWRTACDYAVPAYIVKTDDEDALRQIFDRTNTFGKRMTGAEVFHALHTAPAEKTTDLRALADEVNASGFGSFDDNTLLFCVLGVRDPDVLRDFHTEFDAEDELQETFRRARAAIRLAIAFLREDAEIPHLSLVPYQHLTVTTVRYFALHPRPRCEPAERVPPAEPARRRPARCGRAPTGRSRTTSPGRARSDGAQRHRHRLRLPRAALAGRRAAEAVGRVVVQHADGLALRLRDTHRMDGIDRETFARLARKAGADTGATVSVVDDTLDRMRASWADVVDECRIERSFRERLARHHASVPLLANLCDR